MVIFFIWDAQQGQVLPFCAVSSFWDGRLGETPLLRQPAFNLHRRNLSLDSRHLLPEQETGFAKKRQVTFSLAYKRHSKSPSSFLFFFFFFLFSSNSFSLTLHSHPLFPIHKCIFSLLWFPPH